MSIKISALKKSKILVLEYLQDNYPNEKFNAFYSIGEQNNDFSDQFLKIETNFSQKDRDLLKDELLDFLVKTDAHYESLRIRMSDFKFKK